MCRNSRRNELPVANLIRRFGKVCRRWRIQTPYTFPNSLERVVFAGMIAVIAAIGTFNQALGATGLSESIGSPNTRQLDHFESPNWMEPTEYDADGIVAEIIALPSDFNYTTAICKVSIAANEQQLISLLDATMRASHRTRAINAYRGFFARLANLYPRSAYAFIQSRKPHGLERELRSLFLIWTLNDAEAAVAFAETLEGTNLMQAGFTILTANQGFTRARIQQVAAKLGVPVKFPSFTDSTAQEDEEPDPQIVFQKVVKDYEKTPSNLIHQITGGWAAKDPVAAWVAVDEFVKPQDLRTELALEVQRNLINVDPKASLEMLLGLDHMEVAVQLEDTLRRIARTEPEYALQATGQLNGRALRKVLTQRLLEAVVQVDLELAVEFIADYDEPQIVEATRIAVAMQHALSSPQHAIELLQTLDGSGDRSNAIEKVCRLWSVDDVAGNLSWLEPVTDERVFFTCARVLLQAYGRRDPQSALDAALNIVDASRRKPILSNLMSRIAKVDPVLSSQLIGRVLAYDEKLDVQPLMKSLMDVGRYQEAINSIDYLPESDREASIQSFFRELVDHDVDPLHYLHEIDTKYFSAAARVLLNDYRFAHSHSQEVLGYVTDPEQRQQLEAQIHETYR